MTSEPKAPGAPAIYLYRQVDRDDVEGREHVYDRIKILSEDGRKHADVEIPFLKGFSNIKSIQARTIHPDGTIVNFNGQIYDKMVVKAKGWQFLAKTFSMPDVQVGSIIEYKYLRTFPEDRFFDTSWLLSEELFTKHGKFSLRPHPQSAMRSSWSHGLPQGAAPPVTEHGIVRMEIQDVPGFQIEDYMPPPDELKYRVDFVYTRIMETDSERFWSNEARWRYGPIQAFTDKKKAMEEAVAQIVSPGDSPEQKLQKIYSRCQKIRNTSFEAEKTKEERDRENLKPIENVEDVWKRGYGNRLQITLLFLALARDAGFESSPVLISTRDKYFFNPKLMNASDLNREVVLVKLNGQDVFLDPGVPFAPFGLLPWYETGVQGLRIDKDGGSWLKTTMPDTASSGMERKAKLTLDDSGSLEGAVTITFKGLSALLRRLDEREEDTAARKKFLENEIKDYVPVPIEVELTNNPDWTSASSTLVAEYQIKIPNWAVAAGHRTLLSVGLFGGGEKHVFEHAARVHPIYYHYAYLDQDDVTINLPQGWQVGSLPQPRNIDARLCVYHSNAQSAGNALHLTREFAVNLLMLDAKYYGALQNFYQQVRTGDEQEIVLSGGAPVAQN